MIINTFQTLEGLIQICINVITISSQLKSSQCLEMGWGLEVRTGKGMGEERGGKDKKGIIKIETTSLRKAESTQNRKRKSQRTAHGS